MVMMMMKVRLSRNESSWIIVHEKQMVMMMMVIALVMIPGGVPAGGFLTMLGAQPPSHAEGVSHATARHRAPLPHVVRETTPQPRLPQGLSNAPKPQAVGETTLPNPRLPPRQSTCPIAPSGRRNHVPNPTATKAE